MSEPNVTPMMKQYLSIKEEYKDEVLFFRLGDFYEMFMEDAVEVSRILNLTLTKRNGNPMCGIPYHAAKTYLKRLLDEGKKIAICEQTKMPEGPGAIAEREVVQVITPGTVVEDEFLDDIHTSYILACTIIDNAFSVAYCDVSSLSFYTAELAFERTFHSLRTLLEQLSIREIVIDDDLLDTHPALKAVFEEKGLMVNRLPSWHFSRQKGFEKITEAFQVLNLNAFSLSHDDVSLAASGALLYYIEHTAKQPLSHLQSLTHIRENEFLSIDESSRRNLELLNNLQDSSSRMTLFSSINDTVSSSGSRLLQEWIQQPLRSSTAIEKRQERVQWFIENGEEHHRIRSLLKETRDVMRIISRVSLGRHTPLDLLTLSSTLTHFFTIISEHTEMYLEQFSVEMEKGEIDQLLALSQILTKAISPQVSSLFTPHSIIQDGYDEKLDSLRHLMNSGSDEIASYVTELKNEYDIPQIKLSYNKIIGHYMEITKTHSAKVPSSFFRKQTLVNSERYTTEELMRLEGEINASQKSCADLEMQLFGALVEQVKANITPIYKIGRLLSEIDCIQSFSYTAVRRSFARPLLSESQDILIEEGRHPVVEQFLPQGTFIANPLYLNNEKKRLALITGPNMAGKSTYLRQNALIIILAHIGSYVPASRAVIPLSDAVFCRVGASDNLARGESTFLIEMQEAAYILRNATDRSLIIMDEIGRGTSTQDGLSIAYSVMRTLEEKGINTLFATHYHELTMMDTSSMQLLTLAVREQKKKIIFLRKLIEGSADSSYGLHVAQLAGMPKDVLSRALQFQREHYASYALSLNEGQLDLFASPAEGEEHPVIEMIRSYPLDNVTPVDTMNFVASLKKMVEEDE